MATPWNFREILNIDLEKEQFTCMGNVVSNSLPQQCQKTIQAQDIATAQGILHRMDRSTEREAIFKGLEELTECILCPEHQTNLSNPQSSHANKLFFEWKDVFREQWIVLRKEHDRKAIERYKLHRMRSTLQRLRAVVDDGKVDKVY
jgi:hypothetical protein